MAILVFGSLNIDRTFYIPHFLKEGETLHSRRMSVQAGGKGANQAVAISKAGADVKLAGTIGADGTWILPLLEKYGVDTSLISIKSDKQTGTADILVDDNGRNGIVLNGGCNLENDEEYIDKVFDKFVEGDWVIFENEVNNLPYLYYKAIKKNMKICFNASPIDNTLVLLPLEKTSLLVVNEIEGATLASCDGEYQEVLEKLVSMYPDTEILLTIGKHGSLYGFNEKRHYQNIVESSIKDTTAAGDTFLGFFLAMLVEGKSVEEAMLTATKASSITVSRPGAMDSIPYISEVYRPE